MTGWELIALLIAWGLAGGSPGPATLTISSTAMTRGSADDEQGLVEFDRLTVFHQDGDHRAR